MSARVLERCISARRGKITRPVAGQYNESNEVSRPDKFSGKATTSSPVPFRLLIGSYLVQSTVEIVKLRTRKILQKSPWKLTSPPFLPVAYRSQTSSPNYAVPGVILSAGRRLNWYNSTRLLPAFFRFFSPDWRPYPLPVLVLRYLCFLLRDRKLSRLHPPPWLAVCLQGPGTFENPGLKVDSPLAKLRDYYGSFPLLLSLRSLFEFLERGRGHVCRLGVSSIEIVHALLKLSV